VNLPFRAPLLPDGPLAPQPDDQAASHLGTRPGILGLSEADHAAIDAAVGASRRPLIVVGPLDRQDVVEAIGRLSTWIGAPVIADGLSGMRFGDHDRSGLVARADLVLRSEAFRRAHAPDLVIRFGAAPTSAGTLGFLDTCDAPRILVDDGSWDDPALRGGMFVRADPAIVAESLMVAGANGSVEMAWRDAWIAAGDRADAAVRTSLSTVDEPFEGAVFAALEGRLPPGTCLVVSSSMPVRDLDTFLADGPTPLRCIANRGANGIDGVVSTALGVAAAGREPVLAIVGDLAFLHDANALLGARLNDLSLTVVVIDNDGGGIFSFLPQGEVGRPEIGLPEHYEQLFGTPHGMDVLAVARAFGVTTIDLEPVTMGEAITAALGRSGVHVLRLRTDRARNVMLHRQVQAAAITAVEANA
jgi:2-succinyl-5-enolpyruvyl-6-hydroxy-3-cyclohexene-1-carboxylate synthase